MLCCNSCKLDVSTRKSIELMGEHDPSKPDILVVFSHAHPAHDLANQLYRLDMYNTYYTYLVPCATGKTTEAAVGKLANKCDHFAEVIKDFEKVVIGDALVLGQVFRLTGASFSTAKSSFSYLGWVGFKIPDQNLKKIFYCVWDRFNLCEESRSQYNNLAVEFISQLDTINKDVGNHFEVEPAIPEYITGQDAIDFILSIYDNPNVYTAFDYETNGLYPLMPGANIRVGAITDGKTIAVLEGLHKDVWKTYLEGACHKIAHNISFEIAWSVSFFNAHILPTASNFHCTQNMRHASNPAFGLKGLKPLTYGHFGVGDYAIGIDEYLKGDKDIELSFNRVDEAPEELLYKYVAADVWYTYTLFFELTKQLEPRKEYFGADLITKASIAFGRSSLAPILIDMDYTQQLLQAIEREQVSLENKIEREYFSDERVIEKLITEGFVPYDNKNKEYKFNINSPKQKARYIELKFNKKLPKTATGNPKADKETIAKLKLPFEDDLNLKGKYTKITATLKSLLKYTIPNGDHTGNISLNMGTTGAVTYRTNAYSPNVQQIPKRDKFIKDIVRSCMLPQDGYMFMEADYATMEVRIGTWYHQDPNMIQYICDKSTDMHRDQACECFMLKPEEVSSDVRSYIKGSYVFATSYGKSGKNKAEDLWEWLQEQPKLKEHVFSTPLKKAKYCKDLKFNPKDAKGNDKYITSKKGFIDHILRVDKYFWEVKFKRYGQWVKQLQQDFKHNYVLHNKTGFKFKAPLQKTTMMNYPVQSSACHVLLYVFIKLQAWLAETGMKTKIVAQIHDALLLMIHPTEVMRVSQKMYELATKDVTQFYGCNIPLDLDFSLGEINGAFHKMVDIDKKDLGL